MVAADGTGTRERSWVDGSAAVTTVTAFAATVVAATVLVAALALVDRVEPAAVGAPPAAPVPGGAARPASTAAPTPVDEPSVPVAPPLAPRHVPTGWVPVVIDDAGLAVAMPAAPSADGVAGSGGRVERTVEGEGGWLLSVTSIPRSDVPAELVIPDDLVERVGSDLGAPARRGAATLVDGLPALPFDVATASGTVQGVVIDAGDRVHTVLSFVPIGGDGVAGARRFDLAVGSLAVAG